MHKKNKQVVPLAVATLIKRHEKNPSERILNHEALKLRIEAYGKSDEVATCFGVFNLDSRQLKSLVTKDAAVLRRYTQITHHLPVHERFALGFAGIMMVCIIEQNKYEAKPNPTNTILKDYLTFVGWLTKAESQINKSTRAQVPACDELESIDLSSVILDLFTGGQSDQPTLTNQQLFNLLSHACETFLATLETRYKDQSQWDQGWKIAAEQARVDLVAFNNMAPTGPIIASQSRWINALIGTEESTHNTLFKLSNEPTAEETIHFLTAAATDVEITHNNVNFFLNLGRELILLSTRAALTPVDFWVLIRNMAPTLPQVTYPSTYLEGALLAYASFGGPQIVPEGSILGSSIQPVSAQAARLMTDYDWKDGLKQLQHVAQTVMSSFLHAPALSAEVMRDIRIEMNAGSSFENALTEPRLEQIALTLKHRIDDATRSLKLVFHDDATQIETIQAKREQWIIDIDTAMRNREQQGNSQTYEALCMTYLNFSAEMAIVNRQQAQQMQAWESGEPTHAFSFFPSLLFHEVSGFANNNLIKQRAGTLTAGAVAILGLVGTPYFNQSVDHINKVLTGKTFAALQPGDWISPLFMALWAFQANLLITSLPYGNDSLLMTAVKALSQDPLKVALGVSALLGVANGLTSRAMVDTLQFLSCQAKLSKTSLLFLPERCIGELVEALHLASVPQILQMLIAFKFLTYFRTLLSEDRHATPAMTNLLQGSSFDDTALMNLKTSANKALLQMVTWKDLSEARDIFGYAPAGAFFKVMNSRDWNNDPDTKQMLAQFYRHYMTKPAPVFVNFMHHVVRGMSLSLAYAIPVVPKESLLTSRELQWNIRSRADAAKWVSNTALLALSAWWLLGYRMERDGSIFSAVCSLVKRVFYGADPHEQLHVGAHSHCFDHAICLDSHNAYYHSNHSLLEEMVENCVATITSCSCMTEGATQDTLNDLFYKIKIASLILIGLMALQYWMRWNSPLTQQAREHTKDFWKTIGSSLSQSGIDVGFASIYFITVFVSSLFNTAASVYRHCAPAAPQVAPETLHDENKLNPTLAHNDEAPEALESGSTPITAKEPKASEVHSPAITTRVSSGARLIAYWTTNSLFSKQVYGSLNDNLVKGIEGENDPAPSV